MSPDKLTNPEQLTKEFLEITNQALHTNEQKIIKRTLENLLTKYDKQNIEFKKLQTLTSHQSQEIITLQEQNKKLQHAYRLKSEAFNNIKYSVQSPSQDEKSAANATKRKLNLDSSITPESKTANSTAFENKAAKEKPAKEKPAKEKTTKEKTTKAKTTKAKAKTKQLKSDQSGFEQSKIQSKNKNGIFFDTLLIVLIIIFLLIEIVLFVI